MNHYYSLNEYLIHTFGEKVYKISLNGGMTCPNRDGTLDTRGCIFCSGGGSGDFAGSASLSVTEQIEDGKRLLSKKYSGNKYIAYFQAYTNTYAPIEKLHRLFYEAINHPDIVCLSIATRPDCLDDEIIRLLTELNRIKPVWIELGLQTIHEDSASFIRRGYPLSVYDTAVGKLKAAGISVITHMIVGLPHEDASMMYETARYIARCGSDGIKIQLLHILNHTDLGKYYLEGNYTPLTLEEYMDILFHIIELLPPDMVIHRITGDGPKKLLLAPPWSGDKKKVLNTIQAELDKRNIIQGKLYKEVT